MDTILKMYTALQKSDPLIFVRDDIHTCNQLIKMCENELTACGNPTKIEEINKEIVSYKEQLIHLQNIIDSHNKGDTYNISTITNIETNF